MESNFKCIAIIPARGGSKGIPRKNVLPLAGKPLIAHNIEQARAARFVDRVIVSTDDAEIGAVAHRYGAEVIWRPAEISGDRASSESALLHALEHLQESEGYRPDLLVFLQCTSPLTIAADIDGTVQALLDVQADSALAVTPFHYFLWRQEGDDVVGINHDKRYRPLRQERPPQYLETGAVYVMRVPGFQAARHRFFGRTALYIQPAERRWEIDDPVDFQVAEVLLRQEADLHSGALQTTRRSLPDSLQALVLDFDGVFTDNRVLVIEDGREAVLCDRSDGSGIVRLKESGLPILILSTERNPVVRARSEKLGLPCLQGQVDKGRALRNWLDENHFDPACVAYVGNDLNDLDCMHMVGYVIAPADAYPEVLAVADLVLKHAGGHGALRELSDLILARKKYA